MPENVEDFMNKKKMYVAFLILFFFEVTIMNIYLLKLLREKISKIKSIIYSSRVTPFIYYLSRVFGDLIFTCFLYSLIYFSLRIGAQNLIKEFNMADEFLNLWGLVFIWKIRYILIGYVISHFITGNVDQVLKYYMYIYALVNGGFVALQIYYPFLPFDYVFDSGSLWLFIFKSDYVLHWNKEVGGMIINFILAVGVSTLIDNYKLNRNFWDQKKGRVEMKARMDNTSKRNSLDCSFQSDQNASFNSGQQTAPLMENNSLSQRSFYLNNDLKIRQLSKTYGTCFKKQVIKNLSFDLTEQTAFGLVGPNGSGKTTTFRILAGELGKTSGYAFLDGKLKFGIFGVGNSLYWKQNIGVCFQNDFLYKDLTVEQHISFYSKLNGLKYRGIGNYFEKYECLSKDPSLLMETKESFEMGSISDTNTLPEDKETSQLKLSDLPDDSDNISSTFLDSIPKTHNPFLSGIEKALDILRFRNVKAQDLSSGNKRKLCLLISLLKNLNLAIWDEATCGLDVLARYAIRQLLFSLKTENKAKLLITTHFLNDVDLYCDQIGILKKGVFGFIGTTEALKDQFGGYCVVVRGSNKSMSKVLEDLKAIASCRILEQKESVDITFDDSVRFVGVEANQKKMRKIIEDSQDKEDDNMNSNQDKLFGLRKRNNSGTSKKIINKRPSLHVNFVKKNLQSLIKLHVEDFKNISTLFNFLQMKLQNNELYDFFLNQYNVEHIYVELMKGTN